MVFGYDDFETATLVSLTAASSQVSAGTKRKAEVEPRSYLKVYETLGPQLLNAYGEAKFMRMDDKTVWEELSKPMKSGAIWMCELCDKSAERRGIGFNRWCMTMINFCRYQMTPMAKQAHEFMLKPEVHKEIIDEITKVLPSLEYCLAPKKEGKVSGASSLSTASGVTLVHVVVSPYFALLSYIAITFVIS